MKFSCEGAAPRSALVVVCLLLQIVWGGTVCVIAVGDHGSVFRGHIHKGDIGERELETQESGRGGQNVEIETVVAVSTPQPHEGATSEVPFRRSLKDADERAPIRGLKRIISATVMITALLVMYQQHKLPKESEDWKRLHRSLNVASEAVFFPITHFVDRVNAILPKDKALEYDLFVRTVSLPLFLSGLFELILSVHRRMKNAPRGQYPLRGIPQLISAAICFAVLLKHLTVSGEDYSAADRRLTGVGTSLMIVGTMLFGHSLFMRLLDRKRARSKNFVHELHGDVKETSVHQSPDEFSFS